MLRRYVFLLVALGAPGAARAHHEAIFGPQSSLVLSAPAFVSLQCFTRRWGQPALQETTAVVSAGVSPFRFPLSFTAIAPASYLQAPSGSRSGVDDLILGARYRFDFDELRRVWGKDGNFAMVMGSAELPTGMIDHPAFEGPLDYMGALLASLEKAAFSGILYSFGRYNGPSHGGTKPSDNLFFGSGFAWTPLDEAEGRLLSFQLGTSLELYAQEVVEGGAVSGTGGHALLFHPTVVWGPGHRLLTFVVASLPAVDSRPPAQAERFRLGGGVVYLFD
jgi:hypothetical protein